MLINVCMLVNVGHGPLVWCVYVCVWNYLALFGLFSWLICLWGAGGTLFGCLLVWLLRIWFVCFPVWFQCTCEFKFVCVCVCGLRGILLVEAGSCLQSGSQQNPDLWPSHSWNTSNCLRLLVFTEEPGSHLCFFFFFIISGSLPSPHLSLGDLSLMSVSMLYWSTDVSQYDPSSNQLPSFSNPLLTALAALFFFF